MALKSGIETKVSGKGKQRPKMITVLRAPEPEHLLPRFIRGDKLQYRK
jgi:hypothetical protein